MPYSCINHSSHSTSNNIVYSANIPSVSCSISSPSAARSTPPSPSSNNTCSNQVTDHCELNSRSSYSPEKTKPHREQYKGKSPKNLYFTHSKNYQHPSEISTNWRADSALQSKSQEVTQDSKVAAQSSNFNVIHLAQVQGANSNLSLEIAPIQDPSKMIPFPFFAIPVMNVPQSYEGSGNYQSGDAGTNQANGSNQQPNPQTPGVSPAPPISSMMMQAPSAPSMPLQQPGPPSPSSLPSPGQGYTSGYPSPYFIANAMPQMMNNENMPMNPYMITAPPVFVNNSSPVEGPLYGPGPPIITGDRLKGPRGCNLFVFHLPNEITNWDLYLLFRRHGDILSVHIMVNKVTGLSKGYGFVSFANPLDAQNAIDALDGFRLGKKRLKVQLKRLQDDNEEEYDDDWENESSPVTEELTEMQQNFSIMTTNDSTFAHTTAIHAKDMPVKTDIRIETRAYAYEDIETVQISSSTEFDNGSISSKSSHKEKKLVTPTPVHMN